jgi:hypothetical protein
VTKGLHIINDHKRSHFGKEIEIERLIIKEVISGKEIDRLTSL